MPSGHDSHLLLRALADELARSQVAGVVTSPGSRSVPVVLALAQHPGLQSHSVIDERAAGFLALGIARATGRPAVLACTSGTAAANYLPAVIEAHEAGVPLIVITADRPAELRDVGAGQAIDQLGLFGTATRWFQHLDPGDASAERLAWIRQLGCRAAAVAGGLLGDRPGPVHLNVPLREPLVPPGGLPPHETGGRPDGAPWTVFPPAATSGAALGDWLQAHAGRRGLVVAGAGTPQDTAGFAARLGWPLLADPLSGARTGAAAVAHYDLLLRSEAFAAAHEPEAVLRLGALPTSKPLRTWLAGLGVPQATMDGTGAWSDPDAAVGTILPTGGALPEPAAPAPGDWLASWRAADGRAATMIEPAISGPLTEPAVAAAVAGAPGPVVIASSMPIRDCETFWPVLAAPPRAVANRGANGIDGTIATAFGVAAASTDPVTLLIGDVAFLHDLGGLAAGTRLGLRLTIVLVDNDGGGIFDFLPVGDAQPDGYAEHVTTAPGLDLPAIAAAAGATVRSPASAAELAGAIAGPGGGVTVLHVRTDRAANVALHREIAGAVSAVAAG